MWTRCSRFRGELNRGADGNRVVVRLVCMKTVGVCEAKTHLNKLVDQVSRGESIRITRRGVPVVILIPERDQEKPDLKKVVKEIRRIRQGASLGGMRIRDLIHEGRRY